MLRRSIRRASRYLQTTVAVLTAAAQRHMISRKTAGTRRLLTQRGTASAKQLLSSSAVRLTARQQLFVQQQLTRKARASRLLAVKSKLLHSIYRIKNVRLSTQSSHTARSLERKLLTRRNTLTATLLPYRSSALLTRSTVSKSSR